MPSCKDGPPNVWDIHGISGKRCCKSRCVIFSTLSTRIESMKFQNRKSRFIHPQWDRQPKTQWRIFKELWGRRTATADFTWQIPYTNHVCLLENKIQECTCSQIAAEATHWIEEVVIIDPVGDLMFSSSVRVRMPYFEVLEYEDCCSTEQNHTWYLTSKEGSVWRNQQPKKRTVSLRGKTGRWPDSRVLPGHWEPTILVENNLDLFAIVLRNDDVQEYDSKWDRNSINNDESPIWWTSWKDLYKLRFRESEKIKTVLELYKMEIHQKKVGLEYHRLKTMVKRSIEHNLQIKNFETRNGNYETNAVVKNQVTKQREQRSLGDCWQWKANGGSLLKETITVSDTIWISVHNRHCRILLRALPRGRLRKMRRGPEVPEEKVPVVEMCRWSLQGLPQRNLQ